MRTILLTIIFNILIVQSLDINDFIPLETMKEKIIPFVNLYKFFKSNMTNQNFYDLVDKDQQKWILDRLATRNDLIRILKTIFKIITFKKIAKFFIITGFLFFYPVLNQDEKDPGTLLTSDDDFDFYAYLNKTDYRSIERYNFFMHSMEAFSNPLMVWCVAEHDAFCRFQNMFDIVDQIYTFDQVARRFLPNSTIINMQLFTDKFSALTRRTLVGQNYYEHENDEETEGAELYEDTQEDDSESDDSD